MDEVKIQVHIMSPTSISFHVNWPSHSRDTYFDVKILGQGYGSGQSSKSRSGSNILSTQIPFVSCQSAFSFLIRVYGYFKSWPRKSKVNAMGGVQVQVHKVGPTSYWLIRFVSCQLALLVLRYAWLLSKLTLKIQGQDYSSRSNIEYNILMSIGTHISEIWLYRNLTLKIKVNVT